MDSTGATALSAAIEHHESSIYNRLPTSPRTNGLNQRHSNKSYFSFEDQLEQMNGTDYDNSYVESFNYDTAQQFFERISSKDESTRLSGLNNLYTIIVTWARKQYSCRSRPSSQVRFENDVVLNHELSNPQDNALCPIQQVIGNLLRLSVRCPFDDVRDRCDEILNSIKEMKVEVHDVGMDISSFIPNEEIHSVETDDEHVYELYISSFLHNCRLENMVMIMGLHPQYLDLFLECHCSLLSSQGMLSCEVRTYIALMAASRHKCSYLVHLLKDHFLLQGGDEEWLKGIRRAPQKLQMLSGLNKLLAHRPWLVTSHHIKDLMERSSGVVWQPQELARAIVLLCHFHSLAIFCLGTGAKLEIDHQIVELLSEAKKSAPPTPVATPSTTFGEGEQNKKDEEEDDVEMLLERMRRLEEGEEEEVTREEINRIFEKEKEEASQQFDAYDSNPNLTESCFSPYIDDPDFGYRDFRMRDGISDVPTFRAQDYTWDDHAYEMLKRYYDEVADVLHDKFELSSTLTYYTLGRKDNVDTTSLRRSIWKYVHCMYGIMYDDYNYAEINKLIEAPLKQFIKTVSCHPGRTDKPLYDSFWKHFKHSEKVQLCIMVMEARLQVSLLYGMRAFTQALRSSFYTRRLLVAEFRQKKCQITKESANQRVYMLAMFFRCHINSLTGWFFRNLVLFVSAQQ